VLAVAVFLAGTRAPLHAGEAPGGPDEPGKTVWLDELDVRLSQCGWRSTQRNKSVEGQPLRLRGQRYERGVGTHSPGLFCINLSAGSRRFTAVVGIDDEVREAGSVEFKIVGDGKLLWRSGIVRGRDPAKKVDVDVAGVKLLKLIVTTGGDNYGSDHADWADARFEVTGARPRAVRAPEPSAFELLQRQFDDLRRRSRSLAEQTFRGESLVLPSERDAAGVVLRRTKALLARLKTMEGTRDFSAQQAELARLEAESARIAVDDPAARERLLDRVRALRRKIAFANPLLDFDRILFIKKHFLPTPHSRGNHMCDQYFGFHAIREGGLFVLEDPFGARPTVRDILADSVCENGRFKGRRLPPGGFLSPDLSYDGKTIVFAFTEAEPTRYKWTLKSTYHIFKVNADGSGLRQLTDGPWNDFDPCWLPNGRIAFISERRGGYGRCHGRPVPTFTLHTMNADGSDIVCISPHETNEWHPSVNHDGLIVYTRWDYVDRGHSQAHHPWITTPDGRDARALQGNFGRSMGARPFMELDVRAIPGSHRYVATAAAHHGQSYGSLVLIDPRIPDDDAMAPLRRLTPEVRFPEAEGGRPVYATAWPLNEEFYLCVYDGDAIAERGTKNNFGICLLDAFGNKELIYRDPAVSCLSPMPLRPRRRPPVLPQLTVARPPLATTARVGVVSVYDSLLPWPAGTRIVALRIIQVLPKTTPSADQPRIGYGSQKNARAVLGTVPVEADGSAYFNLPVGRPVYFQALDEQGMAVQSMRSDTYVQPGETLLCQGCHDARGRRRPMGQPPIAMSRPPSDVQPDVHGSNPFSFPRLVQPVLDRRCVPCHVKNPKAPDLRAGDWKKNPNRWYTSYTNLQRHAFYFGGVAWETPRTIPGKFGARASKLYQMLARGHHDLKLPAEDLHRISLWLDCNSDFFGAYENTEAQARGEIVRPSLE